MKNRKHVTSVFRPVDSTDITTWNLPDGAIARLGNGWISGGMVFSPDGEALVVATTIGCWWYDLNTMNLNKVWDTEQGILSDITFSQDGQWLATGNWKGTVKVWDTQNIQCVAYIDLPKNPEGVRGLSGDLLFSQDGKHLTRSNLNGKGRHFTIYDWQEDTDNPIVSYTVQPEPGRQHTLPTALSPDGNLIAYTPEANITSVMHIETGELIANLRDNYTDTSTIGCHQLVFSPCGKYLAATNQGNKIHIWNVNNCTMEMALTVHSDNRQLDRSVPAYTTDGNLQVAGFSRREVVIWDAMQQETLDTFESHRQLYGCFSSDGTQLAIRNKYGEQQVWMRGNPSMVKSLTTHISRGVVSIEFSKDSRKLLSANDISGGYRLANDYSGYRLWDVMNRQVKQKIYLASPDSPGPISMSRSKELLAALVETRIIKVWNLVSDTKIAELNEKYKGVKRMTFSPTEEYLVTTNIRKFINIWHLASSTKIAALSQNPSRVTRMGFSRTGEYFVIPFLIDYIALAVCIKNENPVILAIIAAE